LPKLLNVSLKRMLLMLSRVGPGNAHYTGM